MRGQSRLIVPFLSLNIAPNCFSFSVEESSRNRSQFTTGCLATEVMMDPQTPKATYNPISKLQQLHPSAVM